MDARAERTISSPGGAPTIHRRPGLLRASDPLGAGQPLVRRHAARRPAGQPLSPALLVLSVHEGVRDGRRGERPVAAVAAGVPLASVVRTPLDELRLAIERTYQGEEGVFVGIFRAPEHQTLDQLQQAVAWYKNETLEKVGFYRMALRFSQAPTPIRRLLWWGTLNISGYKRCKRFGTFGLSSYGSLGAEQIHPISPLTTTLTYGPIDPATGRVVVKLIYDHRVLDGAYIARRLRDIEEVMNGSILDELRDDRSAPGIDRSASAGPPSNVEPLLKPHLHRSVPEREGDLSDKTSGLRI